MFAEIDDIARLSVEPTGDRYLDNLATGENLYNEPYFRFLYHLLLKYQPPVAIEIGVYFGVASAHMAAAAAQYDGTVIGIDINWHGRPAQELKQRYGNYIFLNGDSLKLGDTVKDLLADYGALGLVFQDSSHHYEPSRQEWALYSPLVRKGGLWVCDDISAPFHDPAIDPPGKGMVQYFRGLPGQKRIYEGLHIGNRIGVVLL